MNLFYIGIKYFSLALKADVAGKTDEALAGYCLTEKPGFRFPASAAQDKWLVLKCWLKALRSTMGFTGAVYYTYPDGEEGTAVFDHKASVRDIRVAHLRSNAGVAPRYTIARHDLRSTAPLRFFSFLALSVVLLPWALLRGFSRAKRVNTGLLFIEICEAHALLEWLNKKQVKKLFFYSPFEIDANALYLLLHKNGIEVYKIPSPNLLAIHNRMLLSDILVLTSPYQADELSAFKETVRVKQVLHWRPEQFDSYGHVYNENTPAPREGTIGFYSHAAWVRHAEDDSDTGIGDHESEVFLKKILASYFAGRQDLKVTVFLHPREKKHKDFSSVVKHYDTVFGRGLYEFAPLGTPGSELFHTVDVGLGAISTILFERLFLGYKTLFFPASMKAFPLPSSTIKMICPTTETALHEALDLALHQPSQQYFTQTGLDRYTKATW